MLYVSVDSCEGDGSLKKCEENRMDVWFSLFSLINFNWSHYNDILKYVHFKAEITEFIVSDDKKYSTTASRLSNKTENTLF